jgi:hypothetical protein
MAEEPKKPKATLIKHRKLPVAMEPAPAAEEPEKKKIVVVKRRWWSSRRRPRRRSPSPRPKRLSGK